MRRICKACLRKMPDGRGDGEAPFGTLAALGGLVGCLGAVATGNLVLLPLAALAGLGGDVAAHCDLCGSSDEELYEIPEDGGGYDDTAFLPVKPPNIDVDEPPALKSPPSVFRETVGSQEAPADFESTALGGVDASDFGWSMDGGPALDIGGAASGESGSPPAGPSSAGGGGSGGTGGSGGGAGGGQ